MAIQRFKRMKMSERGHFSNYFTFNPIIELIFDENGIKILKRFGMYRYNWGEIVAAEIRQQQQYKGYGAGSWGKILKRTFVFITKDRKIFKFDISKEFPDFHESAQLEKLLRKRLTVTECDVSKFNIVPGVLLFLVLVAIGLWLKAKGL